MTKSLDPPSKILDHVLALATDMKTAREGAAIASGFDPKNVGVLKAERALRKYLGQQPMAVLRIVMLVERIGSGKLLPGQLRERFDKGVPKLTRLDHAVSELADDQELSGHLAEGLSLLVVEGVSVDTLLD